MSLFGTKKAKDSYDGDSQIDEIKSIIERHNIGSGRQEISNPRTQAPRQREEEPKQIDAPGFAPLFVKIDRYRGILSAIGYLRTALVMVRNSFVTLRELDKAREQTMDLIVNALEKMDGKLSNLDTDLVRPAGYHNESSAKIQEEYHDVETVHASIADLKGQIDQLKSELEAMS